MDLAEYPQIYLNISIRGMRITKIIHPKVIRNGINFEYYFPMVLPVLMLITLLFHPVMMRRTTVTMTAMPTLTTIRP
jgi:hypothetical protein